MINYRTFREIKRCKSEGLNKNQIANYLKLNYNTVNRYWEMDDNEFQLSYQRVHSGHNRTKLPKYRDKIIELLYDHPNSSAAQIGRELEEHFGDDFDLSDRTIRKYVADLRKSLEECEKDK